MISYSDTTANTADGYFRRRFLERVRTATDQHPDSKVVYAYNCHTAEWMRRSGFAFRPLFRTNLKGPSHRRKDYDMEILIKDKKLSITLTI